MLKFNAENERLKRKYEHYLSEAKGQDEKSLDKVRAALIRFEESTSYKSFKKFHIDQARQFKAAMAKAKNAKGKPLSYSTIDATLRIVKGFFHWLAGQPGFKKVVSYPDVDYFNNNRKDARVAHAQRAIPFPSTQAAFQAFQGMSEHTEAQRRDKAIFALVMLTGARAGAVASLRLKHVNLADGYLFQDGSEVKTKASKTFKSFFLPMGQEYMDCFAAWVRHLYDAKLYSPEDALFPKPEQRWLDGKFVYDTLSREPYANSSHLNALFRVAFQQVQQPEYTPHSIRKTLGKEMSDRELTLEEQKAWSQNLGHEHFNTTVSSYLPVSEYQQGELIKKMKMA